MQTPGHRRASSTLAVLRSGPGRAAAASVVVLAGCVAIAGATLAPYEFRLRPLSWAEYAAAFDVKPSSPRDLPENIVLFMPFGFGVALLMDVFAKSRRQTFALTLLAGFLTTACVESLQIWLPDRTPNLADVLGNTAGAAAGLCCLRAWQHREALARLADSSVGRRLLVLTYSGYLSLALLLVWGLMQGMRPGGWDVTYRLALGNEFTQDRPWRGTIQDLVILDRVVQGEAAARLLAGDIPVTLHDAVVAAYPLHAPYGAKDQRGELGDLISPGHESPNFGPSGMVLDRGKWLASETAVTRLADRINATRQFTVAVTIATLDLTQTGPARIVTVSRDLFHRNVTVGQAEGSLALRWRSPLTGDNGATPELRFPAVFSSLEPQRVVISCDGHKAELYSSRGGAHPAWVLGPGDGLTALLRETRYWPVTAGQVAFWPAGLLFSALIFLPLGCLLGSAVRLSWPRMVSFAVIPAGVLMPPLLVETLVAVIGCGDLRMQAILLEIAVTLVGLVSVQLWASFHGEIV